MGLPANCAHPERRASVIRLAIQRVCQAAAAVTTILTEQTEFTEVQRLSPPIAEQIFLNWRFAAKSDSEAAALRRAAEDRRPGRTTGVTRFRTLFHLRGWPGRKVLVGIVIVVAATAVPISHHMWGHRLPGAPAGRILTAARRIGLSNSCGQSQPGQPEAAGHRHRRCASCD